MHIPSRSRLVLVAGLTFTLVATACDGDDDAGTSAGRTNDDGAQLSGQVLISGSSTVEPISARVAEVFQQQNPGVQISVSGPGSGAGFREHFCVGETDINDASRAITDSERELCADNGVTDILELRVGIDGLTVMTSPDNGEVDTCLGVGDMYALVGPESGDVTNWADANPLAEELAADHEDVVSGAPFPDVPLETTGPGTESGTYDTFVGFVMEGGAGGPDFLEERLGEDAENEIRPDWAGQANDNIIIQGITGNQYSFGWVGYAFYVNNQEQVQAFEIMDPGTGECVAPSDDTIASGAYPLSRPLFIYVNLAKAAESPALRAYVDVYLSEQGKAQVSDAGYVEPAADAWSGLQSTWQEAKSSL